MKYKWIFILLAGLFGLLQYELWVAPGGLRSFWSLRVQVNAQREQNRQQKERNKAISADIQDLKRANEAVEERARQTMGMIKQGETFYQVVKSD